MNLFSIYSLLPVWAQNILCSIKGYSLNRERYGGEYNRIFEQLMESDKWTKAEILQYKTDHIRRILEHAYNTTPFYKRFFDDHGVNPSDFNELDDLKKFPILTKEMIRENWKDMLSRDFRMKDLIPYHTSGSTGKALDFFWTKHSVRFYWAVVWRGRHRFGVQRGDLHFNFTGKIVVPISQSKPPYWRFNKPLNQYMINMQHISRDKVESIVDLLNAKQPRFFVGYPSIIHSFALLIEELNLKVSAKVEYMFTSAEKMYDFQRKVIERVFPGTKIVEHYGFSENAASASKKLDMLYHEDFELGHLELNNTKHVDERQSGELIATGFQNMAMPFIRYQIGDTATFISDDCISDIEGRNGDYVITPEGTYIMRFGYIFKQTEYIKECQILQNTLGEMIVRAVIRDNNKKELFEKETTNLVRMWISPSIKVCFEYVAHIPRTKSGKFKAVVSNL